MADLTSGSWLTAITARLLGIVRSDAETVRRSLPISTGELITAHMEK